MGSDRRSKMGKRKRRDSEEIDDASILRDLDISGAGAGSVETGRGRSASTSQKNEMRTGQGSGPVRKNSNPLKTHRSTEEDRNFAVGMTSSLTNKRMLVKTEIGLEENRIDADGIPTSLKKQRRLSDAAEHPGDSLASPLNQESLGFREQDSNGTADRVIVSSKNMRRQKGERKGSDENTWGLLNQYREDRGVQNSPLVDIDSSHEEWTISEEADEESDADYKGYDTYRSRLGDDSAACEASAAESEEEEHWEPALVKKRRKKKQKKKEVVDMSSADGVWARSLKGPHLDLMVSLKQLAEVRLTNSGEGSLSCCLTPASLRTIGIILEEMVKEGMGLAFPSSNQALQEENNDPQRQWVEEGLSHYVDREDQGSELENSPVLSGGSHQSKEEMNREGGSEAIQKREKKMKHSSVKHRTAGFGLKIPKKEAES